MRSLMRASAAAALVAFAPAVASAAASSSSGGPLQITAGTNLPGDASASFMDESYEDSAQDAVGPQAVESLRQMAIAAGQSSSSKDGESETAARQTPPGVSDHAEGYFARVRERGVSVPES